MYAFNPITGDYLPDKTLCLTYDDGPGEQTLPIAEFLAEQGIRATFFVVGKYAVQQQATLARLSEMDHLIGNHTYDHPDLPYYVSVNGNLQSQVLQTDAILKPYCRQSIFFRAPYGKWSKEVANELNVNLSCTLNHIGPIHWDVAGIDCYYWQTGRPVTDAVADYKEAIDEAGKGIVVMHDDIADMDVVKPLNQTLELTKQLIPLLLEDGYRFMGLDEVMASPNTSSPLELYLKTTGGKFVNLQNSSGPELATGASPKSIITIDELPDGKIALKATSGKYLCIVNGNSIQALATEPTPEARFDLIPVFDDRFMLRTHTGHFINVDSKTGKLAATAPYMRLATIFSYQPVQMPVGKPVTLQMQFQLWKKRLAFIKSKLLSR